MNQRQSQAPSTGGVGENWSSVEPARAGVVVPSVHQVERFGGWYDEHSGGNDPSGEHHVGPALVVPAFAGFYAAEETDDPPDDIADILMPVVAWVFCEHGQLQGALTIRGPLEKPLVVLSPDGRVDTDSYWFDSLDEYRHSGEPGTNWHGALS